MRFAWWALTVHGALLFRVGLCCGSCGFVVGSVVFMCILVYQYSILVYQSSVSSVGNTHVRQSYLMKVNCFVC